MAGSLIWSFSHRPYLLPSRSTNEFNFCAVWDSTGAERAAVTRRLTGNRQNLRLAAVIYGEER